MAVSVLFRPTTTPDSFSPSCLSLNVVVRVCPSCVVNVDFQVPVAFALSFFSSAPAAETSPTLAVTTASAITNRPLKRLISHLPQNQGAVSTNDTPRPGAVPRQAASPPPAPPPAAPP